MARHRRRLNRHDGGLALAEQGFETHLIEKSNRLGGNFLDLNYTLEHEDVGGFLTPGRPCPE